jgi:hypothetical protein
MNINTYIKIGICLIVLMIITSCTTHKTNLVSDQSDVAVPINTSRDKIQDGNTNQKPCTIPVVKNKKYLDNRTTTLKSKQGQDYEINIAKYTSTDELFFNREFPNLQEKGNTRSVLFNLEKIEEFSLKDKIFGYFIYGRTVGIKDNSNVSIDQNRMFVFRCFDTNGDSDFEPLTDSDSELLIPDWVIK